MVRERTGTRTGCGGRDRCIRRRLPPELASLGLPTLSERPTVSSRHVRVLYVADSASAIFRERAELSRYIGEPRKVNGWLYHSTSHNSCMTCSASHSWVAEGVCSAVWWKPHGDTSKTSTQNVNGRCLNTLNVERERLNTGSSSPKRARLPPASTSTHTPRATVLPHTKAHPSNLPLPFFPPSIVDSTGRGY